MAHVYLARQEGLEGLQRDVVVKRVLDAYAGNAELVTMFLDEARLLAALSHPNIAQVFDLGQDGEVYYLVMEHIHGPNLANLLDAATLNETLVPLPVSMRISSAVGEALAYLHDRQDEHGRALNVVHRDLTPANVMVGYNGAIKVIDFGIAKAATRVYETRAGVIKGTFGYSAPEQLLGQGPVDHRADVFSLGVLIYEMVAGAHPFAASTPQDMVSRMQGNRLTPAASLNPRVPASLDDLLTRCLRVSPEERFATAREVVRRIGAVELELGAAVTMGDVGDVAQALVPSSLSALMLSPRSVTEFGLATTQPDLSDTDTEQTAQIPVRDEATADTTVVDVIDRNTRRIDRDRASGPGGPVKPDRRNSAPPSAAPSSEDLETIVAGSRLKSPTRASDPGARRGSSTGHRISTPPAARIGNVAFTLVLAILAGLLSFGTIQWLSDEGPERVPQTPTADAPDGNVEHTLRISTVPPGARIHVDSVYIGDAPQTLHVGTAQSRLNVEVNAPGYRSEARAVASSAGQARFVLVRLRDAP